MRPDGADVTFTGHKAQLWQNGVAVTHWSTTGALHGVAPGIYKLKVVGNDGTHHNCEIAVGMLGVMVGQSNGANWFHYGQDHPKAAMGYQMSADGTWGHLHGAGAREFAQHLSDDLGGVPVGLIDAAVAASSVLEADQSDNGHSGWWHNGPDQDRADALVALNHGESPGFVLVSEGEEDAIKGGKPSHVTHGFADWFSYIETAWGAPHIFVQELGYSQYDPGTHLLNDAIWDGIRAGQHSIADASPDDYVSMGARTGDIDPGGPTVHYTADQYMTIADRMETSVLDWWLAV